MVLALHRTTTSQGDGGWGSRGPCLQALARSLQRCTPRAIDALLTVQKLDV